MHPANPDDVFRRTTLPDPRWRLRARDYDGHDQHSDVTPHACVKEKPTHLLREWVWPSRSHEYLVVNKEEKHDNQEKVFPERMNHTQKIMTDNSSSVNHQ